VLVGKLNTVRFTCTNHVSLCKQSPLAEYHPFNTSKIHALNAISPLGLPSAGAKYCVRGEIMAGKLNTLKLLVQIMCHM
jgi:hypothetical protein